tara:strand:- start:3406 stop:3540 length:135 start_codon:yes stop_codon:yes gene_type:complete
LFSEIKDITAPLYTPSNDSYEGNETTSKGFLLAIEDAETGWALI